MKFGRAFGTALIVSSLVSAPAMAQSATGVEQARVGSVTDGEDLRGVSPVVIIIGLAAILGLLIWQLSDSNEPTSP